MIIFRSIDSLDVEALEPGIGSLKVLRKGLAFFVLVPRLMTLSITSGSALLLVE